MLCVGVHLILAIISDMLKKISQREITPNLIKQWKDFLTCKMTNEKGKIHLKVKTIILIY